ncbi:MAG: SGNH/GDSL hydrolase family protein [Actinomycetota bacterium]|nr:SGNH/GDSL hydrolase family protein [Actinomycetota bacterium]
MSDIPVRIELRHDTAANFTAKNTVLLPGEAGIEIGTGKMKLGTDGVTGWNSLPYVTDAVAELVRAEAARATAAESVETARATAAEAGLLTQAQADARYPQAGAFVPPPGGPAKYPHLHAGLARVRAGLGDMKWLEAGDSTVYGYAGPGVPAGIGPGSAVAAHLAGRGYPAALGGSIPNAIGDAALENDPRWVASAAWAPLQGFAVGWANGSASWGATGAAAADTLAFTPSGPALYDSADIYYFHSGGMGSFDARANNQAATPINATVPPGSIGKTTITFPATTNPVLKFGNTTGYTLILEVEPFHSAVPRVRVANAGVSGSTTSQWAVVAPGAYGPLDTIKAYAADVTVFRSGANDAVVGGGIPVATYLTNLLAIGNAAKVSGDFFVSSPAPIINDPALISAYTAALPAFCADNGYGYVPLGERWGSWAGLSPLGFYAGPAENPDGEHPSTLGYADIGDLEATTLLAA